MPSKQLITSKQLLKALEISKTTLYRMTKEGLPHIQQGKRHLYELDKVKSWLKYRNMKPSQLQAGEILDLEQIKVLFRLHKNALGRGLTICRDQNIIIYFHSLMSVSSYNLWDEDEVIYPLPSYWAESQTDTLMNLESHFFELVFPGIGIYAGEVEPVDKPYRFPNSVQQWYIRLRVKEKYHIPISQIERLKRTMDLKAIDLDNDELYSRAQSNHKPGIRKVVTTAYIDNPYLREYVKRQADGRCQLCGRTTFKNEWGRPYLETHHIVPLEDGREDVLENLVALCPNCHRKMHVAASPGDIIKLKEIAKNHSHQID